MANIIKTDKKVQFLHFTGTRSQWETQILNNSALETGYIVYGYIYDIEDKSTRVLISKEVYAGKDSNGLQYIYNGGGNSSSVIVDSYSDAETYIQSGKANEGDIITTKDDNTTYIVLENLEGDLELVNICKRSKWIYAADSSIKGSWHTAEDIITNIGLIKEGITLGDFVNATDGEFSRMIEMMLFKNEKPSVKLTLLPETEVKDPYTQIAINIESNFADKIAIKVYNGSELIQTIDDAKNGKLVIENLKHSTTYRILAEATNEYYTEPSTDSIDASTKKYPEPKILKLEGSNIDHNSLTLTVSSSDASTATLVNKTTGSDIEIDFLNTEASIGIYGLNAGKTYTFVATASNSYYEDPSTKSLDLTTTEFIKPFIVLNTSTEHSASTNYLHINSADISITEKGEYSITGNDEYVLKNGTTTICEGTLDQIKAKDLSYGVTYTLENTYNASLNCSYVEGDTSLYSDTVSTDIYVKVPETASINITKVNGEDYTEQPIEISSGSFTITVDSSARLYSGNVKVYIKNGDTITDISTYSIIEKNTTDVVISGYAASESEQELYVELADEYGTVSSNIKFLYIKAEIFWISFVDFNKSYYDETLKTYIRCSTFGDSVTPYDIFTNTTDKEYTYEESEKGHFYKFIINVSGDELKNVQELPYEVIENIKYYKFVPSYTAPTGSRYILAPTGKSVIFYEGADGNKKTKLDTSIKSYKVPHTYEYNDDTYDIYYCAPGTTWENVTKDGCCFIKLS